jgi:hypothetical protein
MVAHPTQPAPSHLCWDTLHSIVIEARRHTPNLRLLPVLLHRSPLTRLAPNRCCRLLLLRRLLLVVAIIGCLPCSDAGVGAVAKALL